MYLLLFTNLFLLFSTGLGDDVSAFSRNCGRSQGCMFAPPGCENSSSIICNSILTWTVQNEGIQFTIAFSPVDSQPLPNTLYYAAIGLSLDEYMGSDTVITCFGGNTQTGQGSNQRPGNILVSWNDLYENTVLFQASEAILSINNVSAQNGRFQCSGIWNFSGRRNVQMNPERIYDLSDPNKKFYILFVRGTADSFTYALNVHSLEDDANFPWVAKDSISFCSPNGCDESSSVYPYLTQMHQSYILRVIKYKVAASHGLVMFICWWVLISSGILIARYGKKMLSYSVLGAALWFQIHRFLMFLSFCCMTVVFFLIYWQRGWRVFLCGELCTFDEYNEQVHAILGTVTYAFFLFQVLTGIFRPGLDSPIRPYFNLIHRLNGMLIFGGASVTMFLGVDMGKTGLRSTFYGWPYFIMVVVIMIFIFTYALCEWFVFPAKFVHENANSVQKLKDIDDEKSKYDSMRSMMAGFLIFTNSVIGILGTIAIGILLGKVLNMLGA